MCCNLDEVPEIRFRYEDGDPVYDDGEFEIVSVYLAQYSYDRDDITFYVKRKDDAT